MQLLIYKPTPLIYKPTFKCKIDRNVATIPQSSMKAIQMHVTNIYEKNPADQIVAVGAALISHTCRQTAHSYDGKLIQ